MRTSILIHIYIHIYSYAYINVGVVINPNICMPTLNMKHYCAAQSSELKYSLLERGLLILIHRK